MLALVVRLLPADGRFASMRSQLGTGSARIQRYWSNARGRLVVDRGHGGVRFLLVLCRHLRRPEFVIQLVDGPSKGERHLIAEVHWRTRIEPDVKGLVDRHQQRDGVLDCLTRDLFAIHAQHAGTTFGRARAVVFEVEDNGVFAGIEGRKSFPTETLQVEEVVYEYRPAPANVEYVGGECQNETDCRDQQECVAEALSPPTGRAN